MDLYGVTGLLIKLFRKDCRVSEGNKERMQCKPPKVKSFVSVQLSNRLISKADRFKDR